MLKSHLTLITTHMDTKKTHDEKNRGKQSVDSHSKQGQYNPDFFFQALP